MKLIATLLLSAVAGITANAQTTIANGGFENWGGNASPGVTAEPTGWYSNQSGSPIATLGPQTCFQDNSIVHSGTASVRVENATVPIVSTVVNGNVTTGVINAPTNNKSDGYIGTTKYNSTTDTRHMAFTGRPDSLVGWYQYTSGGTGEQGKVKAILHVADYYDPETPTTYHADPTANKIGEALFLTPASTVGTWTRFSVPFVYVAGTSAPAYIMINITSSNDQTTTYGGSKMWIDDLQAVYNTTVVENVNANAGAARVYASEKTVYAEAAERAELNIFDMTGRKVFTSAVTAGRQNSFGLQEMPSGVYLYQLANAATRISGKIVLQ